MPCGNNAQAFAGNGRDDVWQLVRLGPRAALRSQMAAGTPHRLLILDCSGDAGRRFWCRDQAHASAMIESRRGINANRFSRAGRARNDAVRLLCPRDAFASSCQPIGIMANRNSATRSWPQAQGSDHGIPGALCLNRGSRVNGGNHQEKSGGVSYQLWPRSSVVVS